MATTCIAALVAGVLTNWLIGAALFVAGLIWVQLPPREGPPILSLALMLQWVSVAIGLFYIYATGRPLQATLGSDYQPMVVIGLVCIVALVVGLVAGQRLVALLPRSLEPRPESAVTLKMLAIAWAVSVVVIGAVNTIAWQFPSITQPIIALTYTKLAVVYMLFRQLVRRAMWGRMVALLGIEIVLGITGFFAGFREPIVMAIVALLERFDRRSVRHWASVGLLGATAAVLALIWVNVRDDYRHKFVNDDAFAQSRSKRIADLQVATADFLAGDSAQFADSMDRLIDRVWAVYYPALAIARVPAVLPHTNGQLMENALTHILTPRIFFPDKPPLISSSELVRRYSGVWVAGEGENTSIAFGYAAESYVDYGIPLMFIPVALFGVVMGVAYAGLLRIVKHRDLAISVAVMICWISLDSFERSWAKTLGDALTLLIYVGGVTVLVDKFWYDKFRSAIAAQPADPGPERLASVGVLQDR